MDRYRIAPTRDASKFGILDRESYDYCGLDVDGRVLPLEWTTRAAAESWLQLCYRTWKEWEDTGAGPVPRRWRPHPPEPSPFDRGVQFYR